MDVTENQSENFMTKEEVQKDAFLRVEGWKKQFSLVSTNICAYPESLLNMFSATTQLVNNMIEYCLEEGFRPILIIPPTSKIINDMLSKKFMKDCLYSNVSRANKRGIPVLDYLYDERFEDYKLYINSDMLNKTGREKFTKIVINDINNLGLSEGGQRCQI